MEPGFQSSFTTIDNIQPLIYQGSFKVKDETWLNGQVVTQESRDYVPVYEGILWSFNGGTHNAGDTRAQYPPESSAVRQLIQFSTWSFGFPLENFALRAQISETSPIQQIEQFAL